MDDALGWFSGAPHQAGWSGPRPGRDVSWAFASERLASRLASGCPTSRWVEELAGPQRGVHDDGEFPGHRNGGTLEADPLLELEPPCPERALGRGPGQDDGCGLVEEPAEVRVAASRDVAIVVDLARLVAPCGQPESGAD